MCAYPLSCQLVWLSRATGTLLDLGEITRNILLHLIDLSILFDGHSSAQLNTHYGLDSSLMSDIESEGYSLEASPLPDKLDVTRHPKTRQTLTEKLGIRPELITEADCEIVQWACRITSSRAARVSACAIGAVIRQTKHDKRPGPIGVGVDGRLVPLCTVIYVSTSYPLEMKYGGVLSPFRRSCTNCPDSGGRGGGGEAGSYWDGERRKWCWRFVIIISFMYRCSY
jgi:hypothetical protein